MPELSERCRQSHRLRFTGTCDETEFVTRCAQHDYWYHTFWFDNGFVQHGDYDIGLDIMHYGFPKDMNGMSVLDVGTGSGWFATYFEQLGANVTTVDARGYCDFDVFGRYTYQDVMTEKAGPDRILPDGRPIYYSPVSRGFWIMKDLLGLKAEYVNARIYDIRPELFGGKVFDLVFAGAVLMHLRDPIGALMALRSVCRNRIIANAIPFLAPDADRPAQVMLISSADKISWWAPNRQCLKQWFLAAGFDRVEVERTVNLTIDKPFVNARGVSSGASQTLYLAHAYV
jgi:2-polyprenyl-3-methyl-5-hydroxy-6-metoxy-1,4-benzoquinol methylase